MSSDPLLARLRAADPVATPVQTNEQLWANIVAQPGDPRLTTGTRPTARRRPRRPRLLRFAGVAAGIAAIAAAITVTLGGSGTTGPAPLGPSQLRLASFTFHLPRNSHAVSSTPAACAIGGYVVYTPGPGEGASNAHQPAIAEAVTGNGGCVSMLLTNPYTPGAANAPRPAFPVIDQHPVQIGSDSGTIGTYEFLGGSNTTVHGVKIPSGTRDTELNLQIPTSDGQVQDLQVAVAGITEQQLVSIVSSGLNPQQSGSTTSTTGQ